MVNGQIQFIWRALWKLLNKEKGNFEMDEGPQSGHLLVTAYPTAGINDNPWKDFAGWEP